jgi:hypothetical protein
LLEILAIDIDCIDAIYRVNPTWLSLDAVKQYLSMVVFGMGISASGARVSPRVIACTGQPKLKETLSETAGI